MQCIELVKGKKLWTYIFGLSVGHWLLLGEEKIVIVILSITNLNNGEYFIERKEFVFIHGIFKGHWIFTS